MRKRKVKPAKKFFTPAEANATLPLVRAIIRDVTELAASLRDRHERLQRAQPEQNTPGLGEHLDELRVAQADFEREQERLSEYQQELQKLGVELKDPFKGLVDFPCWMENREVCLCWHHGEPEVAHWHEIDAGFAGRQKLMVDAART